MPGLYLVSTPIGNMEDITFRASKCFKKIRYYFVRRYKKIRKITLYFEIKNKLIPYHKFNEKKLAIK